MDPSDVVKFESAGATLQGRLFLPSSGGLPDSATIMLLTGDSPNGIKSKTWPPMIEALLVRGFSVFAFDFQGQGFSGGNRSALCLSLGCQNFVDAHKALSKLVNLQHGRLGLLGSSFGGAVVLAAHKAIPPFAAVALKSPGSFLAQSYETEHGLPEGMEEWRKTGVSRVTGLAYTAYQDSIQHNIYASCLSLNVPVLIVHGDADTIVPIEQSRRLRHLLNNTATLVELAGVNHHYREDGAQERLQQEVGAFFSTTLGAKS